MEAFEMPQESDRVFSMVTTVETEFVEDESFFLP